MYFDVLCMYVTQMIGFSIQKQVVTASKILRVSAILVIKVRFGPIYNEQCTIVYYSL